MVRALVTLLGAAGALALLYLAPEAGDELGNGLWGVAFAIAGAGFALGLLYQAGGIRKPGVRLNGWLLLLVAVPWTLLALGIVAQSADVGSNIAGWTRDVVPEDVLERWVTAMPAFALGSGLLLALALLEPRVGRRETLEPVSRPIGPPPATADGPFDAPGVDETFRPEPDPSARPTAWQSDRVDADTAVTRVTPAAPRPAGGRDDATVVIAPESGPVDDEGEANRTRVIRLPDQTDPDLSDSTRRP